MAPVMHASWNLGGVKLSSLPKGIAEIERKSGFVLNLLSVQEVPRAEKGWDCIREGAWVIHSHRESDTWRGAGICFRADAWSLAEKRAASRGVWCRVRRTADGKHFWIGSAHFTQGATKDVHASEVYEFIQQMPNTDLPVLIGVDANTPFSWSMQDDTWIPLGTEGKGENMVGLLLERDVRLTAPPRDLIHTPTCRPRKTDVQGRHIDVVGGKNGVLVGKGMIKDSYMFVGSDHDAVVQSILTEPGRNKFKRPNTRPKRVVGEVIIPAEITQDALKTMAKQCTVPYKGVSYVDPEHVKVYFQIARRSKQPEAWKRALRGRDEARKQWRGERIKAATAGDWQAYREHTKKGGKGWEDHFAVKNSEGGTDPHDVVHKHFEKIYEGEEIPPFPFPMDAIPRSVDFSLEELRHAVSKGKNGKSNGEDGIPHELIAAINANEDGERKFLDWFNRLLHGDEALPRDWNRAVMVVLPKCPHPEQPHQLRPICLGSSANKIFARMLLERSKPAFVYNGPFQCMGSGRQTIDYVWVVNRLMSLDQEWKKGLYFLKLDIEKAFDNLNRGRFLERLSGKLGNSEELRCWWNLFADTEAGLITSWGSSTVPMRSGIRQGSVESPQVFASVMDWIVKDAANKHGWDATTDSYEGLEFAEMAFVDDCILWSGCKLRLERKTLQLIEELALWGLKVNAEKSQAYYSPYATRRDSLRVGRHLVAPSETLDVMGIPFKVGISPKPSSTFSERKHHWEED